MARTQDRVTAFDPNSGIGELTDWELQNGDNATENRQEAAALKADGDFLRSAQYDKKATVSMDYVAKSKTGTDPRYTMPAVGDRGRSANDAPYVHIDSFRLSYGQNALPSLNISGHYHTDGTVASGTTNYGHEECRKYVPSIEPPAMDIGVPDQFGTASDPDAAFALSENAAVDIRTATYSMQVNHVDELTRDGGHLKGDNYDGTETLEIEFTGLAVEGTDFTVGSGWTLQNKGRSRGNTQFGTSRITLTHHVAHYVAPAQSSS